MAYDNLVGVLNGLAADFMFLDSKEIDIPAAGTFLNQLDNIVKMAENEEVRPAGEVANHLNKLLEKIVIGAPVDKEAGLAALDTGISLLQSIVDNYRNVGRYDGDIGNFISRVCSLTGER